jgi:hypothetical protein
MEAAQARKISDADRQVSSQMAEILQSNSSWMEKTTTLIQKIGEKDRLLQNVEELVKNTLIRVARVAEKAV